MSFARFVPLTALLAAWTGPALAHVTLETPTAAAGASWKAVLRLPHGCDGAATTAIRVEIPQGLFAVKPMPHAGWQLTTETGAYARSYDNHGTPVSEGVTAITWSGGDLPDAWYDEFVFRGSVAGDLAPGTKLAVPVIQSCGATQVAWTATGEAAGEPAPVLTVTAAAAAGGHDHGAMAGMGHAAPDQPVTLGALTLTGAFARATPPGAPVAGGFVTIANAGPEADRLVAASAAFAGRAEIHEMRTEGDRMIMRALPEGLEIPAGGEVALAPGGLHLMFMDLTGPLTEGETAEVTLEFARAGRVTLPLAVLGRGATGPMGH
ncbi:DUF1775 domain-containing protein [Frigidibacter sp. MR17.14]|uniref:DUF1775 domain-containing protein n=1 Tax=Frigidibacter sp. MR17.14 TaxID=3126509 RepID=UPI00301317FF